MNIHRRFRGPRDLGDAAHAMSPIGGTWWSTYALELSRTASTLSGRTK